MWVLPAVSWEYCQEALLGVGREVQEGSVCWLRVCPVGSVRSRKGRWVEPWWKHHPEISAVEGRWAKGAVRGWSGFVGDAALHVTPVL